MEDNLYIHSFTYNFKYVFPEPVWYYYGVVCDEKRYRRLIKCSLIRRRIHWAKFSSKLNKQ